MRPFARGATALLATLGAWLVFAQPAGATSLMPASGNFFDVPTSTQVRTADGNLIITQTVTQTLTGTFTGTASQQVTTVVHKTGAANFFGSETCTCVVAGLSGSLVLGFSGTGAPDGSFEGQFVILSGTGGLANLNGRGTIQSPNSYTGVIHFD
ncbi:MAG: DUF3224 domain-containing protein [Chloroflexi bacterium]|nr:MAG: DUF3224 domain-containing protein [Chloroflexota bacterium]